jgi:hypothetical protein
MIHSKLNIIQLRIILICGLFDRQSQVMKSTERHLFFQNTERTYHCIIMHIFKKQKQKQSILKVNKQNEQTPLTSTQ